MKPQMIDKRAQSDADLIDAILDLAHDLGKHIRLPVSMLPEDAPQPELREAVLRAIGRTRSAPGGTLSARSLWEAFAAEAGPAVSGRPAFEPLRAAVERALAWEGRAEAGEALDRRALDADLSAVGARIRALLDEVGHG
jgi:hypothetical protein